MVSQLIIILKIFNIVRWNLIFKQSVKNLQIIYYIFGITILSFICCKNKKSNIAVEPAPLVMLSIAKHFFCAILRSFTSVQDDKYARITLDNIYIVVKIKD